MANQLTKDVADLSKAMTELTNQFKKAGVAAAATGALFGGLMVRSAKLFNPAEAIRFEYRLRDLGAVIGSVLQPSFEKLSDAVRDAADWLYNMDEGTKKVINAFVTWTVPITAASIALGGLAGILSHLGVAVKAAWSVLTMAGSGLLSLFTGGKGKSAAASLAPTPVFIVGAAPGVFGVGGLGGVGGMGGAAGGGITGTAGGAGKPGMSTGMKVGAGLAIAGGVAGAAFAGGKSPVEDVMGALSAGIMGTMFGGPVIGVIAGGLSLLTAQLKGWMMGTKGESATGPQKSSQGIAPRDVQQFSSVLDPGRKMRMNSLTSAGLPKNDLEANGQATLKSINQAQQKMLQIWMGLGKVMEQQAQNNIAR